MTEPKENKRHIEFTSQTTRYTLPQEYVCTAPLGEMSKERILQLRGHLIRANFMLLKLEGLQIQRAELISKNEDISDETHERILRTVAQMNEVSASLTDELSRAFNLVS